MTPLIKYTGGKYKEYDFIKEYIPKTINNYYEPFFGGGGVFFRLKEENKIDGKSFASDLSEDLIDFYNTITKEEFKSEILKISSAWKDVHDLSDKICEKYGDLFFDVITNKKDIKELINEVFFMNIKEYTEQIKSFSDINFHGMSPSKRIFDSISDKTKRFSRKDISESDETVACNSLKTAIHQGFYFTIRDMYNDWLKNNKDKYTSYERAAQWYYIREFCFGSMFRFGKDGTFNIPFGGIGYVKKDFDAKIEKLLSPETKELIDSASFKVCDFEEALSRGFEEDDFIFLDPPYDSTFSEYDNNSFTREDHERLHNILAKLKCKWLMVIGKTEFIDELYKDFEKIEYNKTYAYQARGTYDSKRTSHIIIKNF